MTFHHLLLPFQKKIEIALHEHQIIFDKETPLKEACIYALNQGGKRFRPALVMMVAEALGKNKSVIPAALAVEYFHTASLIADDLPCMDNDSERRGKPATHIVYGEAIALLASYALIAAGYQAIAENCKDEPHLCTFAIECATANTGILGATGGQFLDLFPPSNCELTYRETVLKKTISLFEISLVFGWIFGGGEINKVSLVKKAAYHYGMAFQMADDFEDAQKDLSLKRSMNCISLYGEEKSHANFKDEIDNYIACLEELNIKSLELMALANYLKIERKAFTPS